MAYVAARQDIDSRTARRRRAPACHNGLCNSSPSEVSSPTLHPCSTPDTPSPDPLVNTQPEVLRDLPGGAIVALSAGRCSGVQV